MKDQYDIMRLALVLAIQSEIEGMKAENQTANANGRPAVYSEGHFQQKAEELRILAYKHNEQL